MNEFQRIHLRMVEIIDLFNLKYLNVCLKHFRLKAKKYFYKARQDKLENRRIKVLKSI